MKLESHDLKYEFDTNLNIGFGLTSASDSLKGNNGREFREYYISFFKVSPEFILKLLPEERFNLSLKYRPFTSILMGSKEAELVSDEFGARKENIEELCRILSWKAG